jgi:hypothetical protein
LEKLNLPGYNNTGLTRFIRERKIESEDNDLSFHLTTKLILFSRVLRVLQDDPATHLQQKKPSMNDLIITVTKRGLDVFREVMPVIEEINKVARYLDKHLENNEMRAMLFGTMRNMLTLKKMQTDLHYKPGKLPYNVIMSNYEYMGLTINAMVFLYFLMGIYDYQFPSKRLNYEVEEILNEYKYLLDMRLSQLKHTVDYYNVIEEKIIKEENNGRFQSLENTFAVRDNDKSSNQVDLSESEEPFDY